MKQINFKDFAFYLLLILFLSACNKNEFENLSKKSDAQSLTHTGVSNVTKNGITMLRFENEKLFNEVIKNLNNLPEKERIKFTRSLNVKSQTDLIAEFKYKVEYIFRDSTKDIEQLKAQYDMVKKEYKEIFIFNTIDNEDLVPYSKIKNFEIEPIVNERGEYMIGTKVYQAELYKDFTDFGDIHLVGQSKANKSQSTMQTRRLDGQSTKSSLNLAWSRTKNRFASIALSIKDNDVYVKLNCQRKTWFGWWSYSTIFYANFYFELSYDKQLDFYQFTPDGRFINQTKQRFHIFTGEIGDGSSFLLGKVLGIRPPLVLIPTLFGDFEVWSRGIGEGEKGVSSTYLEIRGGLTNN